MLQETRGKERRRRKRREEENENKEDQEEEDEEEAEEEEENEEEEAEKELKRKGKDEKRCNTLALNHISLLPQYGYHKRNSKICKNSIFTQTWTGTHSEPSLL